MAQFGHSTPLSIIPAIETSSQRSSVKYIVQCGHTNRGWHLWSFRVSRDSLRYADSMLQRQGRVWTHPSQTLLGWDTFRCRTLSGRNTFWLDTPRSQIFQVATHPGRDTSWSVHLLFSVRTLSVRTESMEQMVSITVFRQGCFSLSMFFTSCVLRSKCFAKISNPLHSCIFGTLRYGLSHILPNFRDQCWPHAGCPHRVSSTSDNFRFWQESEYLFYVTARRFLAHNLVVLQNVNNFSIVIYQLFSLIPNPVSNMTRGCFHFRQRAKYHILAHNLVLLQIATSLCSDRQYSSNSLRPRFGGADEEFPTKNFHIITINATKSSVVRILLLKQTQQW